MRASFNAYILVIIIVSFIILFTGYISMSINQAKAFNVKNEIILDIEKYDVGTDEFKDEIATMFTDAKYYIAATCPESDTISGKNSNWVGYGVNGEIADSGKAAFCVEKIDVTSSSGLKGHYYKVKSFYQLSIPGIEQWLTFSADGETKTIYSNN